jgi:hypothetical protein
MNGEERAGMEGWAGLCGCDEGFSSHRNRESLRVLKAGMK